MVPPCNDTRERLLADSECASTEAHVRDCGDCRSWWARTQRLSLSIAGLPRIAAPDALTEAVRLELADSSELEVDGLLERALRSLPRVCAPAILDDLVLAPSLLNESVPAQLLGNLSRVSAPAVLERLVGEELEAPARHRVERFVGDLPRATVPAALDESPVESGLKQAGRAASTHRADKLRRVLAPLAAIAAGLFLWTNFSSQVEKPEAVDYGFDVVRVSSPEQFSPLAQSFLNGMTSGSRLVPDSEEEGAAR